MMPILERDPWRFQFFRDVFCPESVSVPTDDIDAWPMNPQHNWVYDRLLVAKSQGLMAAPHGAVPPAFPVFSKPIVNLRGMGIGSKIIQSQGEMSAASSAGHFWMPLLEGEHLSTDCAVENGDIRWLRSCKGEPAAQGMFQHWTLLSDVPPEVETKCRSWVIKHLAGYSGMLNLETIGGTIIEVHLRFSDQWCDLYGDGWIDAVVRLYQTGHWHWSNNVERQGFSIPLFARPDRVYRHPPRKLQEEIRSMPAVQSLQITFHDGRSHEMHAMPPGGMRLAIVNCWNLAAGHSALDRLASWFPAGACIRS